jgi:hypothetical protein
MTTPNAATWETVLATVLNIQIPDRSAITGQPWLTIVQGGQPVPGAHLIWNASWKATPTATTTTSLQVYLNPALYAAGGAWDQFSNTPQQALSAPASLPLVPSTFKSIQLALAGVTTGIYNVSTQMDSIYNDTTSGPLQGNVATVMGELFSGLHGAALNIYDQLSNPSYSDAVGAAGDAATAFLSDINSAYTAWSQLAEHSPLGAVVQVLTAVAAPDGNGAFTVADPQNTPLGDLTTAAAWASIEQQAKNIWLGTLTGSNDFAGLDPLASAALNRLVGQYTTTMQTVKPVVAPGQPPVTQTPVNTASSNGNGPPVPGGAPQVPNGTSQPPGGVQGPGGGPQVPGGVQGPGGGPQTLIAGSGVPGPGGTVPGNVPNTVLAAAGGGGLPSGTITSGASAQSFAAQPSTALGGTTGGGSVSFVPGLIGLGLVSQLGANQNPEPGARFSAGLNLPSTDGVLNGAIGAMPILAVGSVGPEGAGSKKSNGFTGTVGRGPEVKGQVDVGIARAPAAGFAIGGGPDGTVLSQSAVPVVVAKPPTITSGTVNMQLTPTSLDGGGLPSLPGSPPGVLALAGPPGGPPDGTSMLLTNGGPGGIAGGALGADGVQAGAGEPMMMPPYALGGRGQQDEERERRAYLPEDEDYWGTAPRLSGPGVDAIEDEDEPDFDGSWLPGRGVVAVDEEEGERDFDGPRLLVGIGAEVLGSQNDTETISDWRMR